MIDYSLLFAALAGITLLLVLILYFKIQAFLSLLIASIAVGVLAGMPPADILKNIQEGMANTLGFIAVVVGLGAMFGAILESSGGVQSLASFILRQTGEKRASWALMATGFLVSIPVFFDVGFVILVPVVYALQKKTGKSLLYYGLPLLAGLAVTHAFVPPTPGPVAVASILGADIGLVILAGIIAGVPAAIVGGPVFAGYISRKIYVETPSFFEAKVSPSKLPSPAIILSLISLPLVLILLKSYLDSPLGSSLPISANVNDLVTMLGHPFVALIIANLLAWYLLGTRKGFSKQELLDMTTSSLGAAGIIILITGAGGVFKQILTETGTGKMIADVMTHYGLSAFFFAFLTAAAIRIMQGSATVAMITAAGMTASLLEGSSFSDMHKALLVVAIASGASILSHVNDSGFWLVSKYFGLTERQTLRSWTVTTTLISLTGFLMVLLMSAFV